MEVYVEPNPMHVSAAKIVLTVAGPAQKLIQSPVLTHYMCNQQSLKILLNDGYQNYYRLISSYAEYLDKGVTWADSGFKNLSHFLHPETAKGLQGWTNAARECNLYWNKAIQCWKKGSADKAFFYLGAAIHLVQDLCVPHHALGLLFDGHHQYEDWVEKRSHLYTVEAKGLYDLGATPAEWLFSSARVSSQMIELVQHGAKDKDYHEATTVLLPRAQRVTAGFIVLFLDTVLKKMSNLTVS